MGENPCILPPRWSYFSNKGARNSVNTHVKNVMVNQLRKVILELHYGLLQQQHLESIEDRPTKKLT